MKLSLEDWQYPACDISCFKNQKFGLMFCIYALQNSLNNFQRKSCKIP